MVTTIHTLRKLKQRGQPIVALTAWEYATTQLLDHTADLILVGDSLAMVVLGYPSTLPITLAEMLHHCRAVRRAVRRALMVVDLPFGSYQAGPAQAFETASHLMKEGGAEAVKVEGGYPRLVETVAFLVEAGVPVCGHIGLTPQSVHQLGGYRTQGTSDADAARLLAQARDLQDAGAFALVLEHMPSELAAEITRALTIPTIGIGAGPHCDGQILVTHDLLGLSEHAPPFVRSYADLRGVITQAVTRFGEDVRARTFPEQ